MRRKKYRQQKQKSKKNLVLVLVIILLILIFSIGFYFIFIIPRLEKFIFLNKTENGGGEIVIVNSDNVTKYLVSDQKLLVSSRGFGEYKINSLWVLGEKEGYGGKLAVESVAKNYSIPIYLWKDGSKSNLSLKQIIKTKLIKLTETLPVKTLDNFDLPKSVLVEFVDNDIQEQGIMVEVDDYTGSQKTVENISSILGVMGTKIVGYSKGYDESLDCFVIGENKKILTKMSMILGCDQEIESRDNIKIRLGAKFVERF